MNKYKVTVSSEMNQEAKATEDVEYMHNGILLNHEKEGNLIICNNMNWAWGYYALGNKLEKNKYLWLHLYVES